jgi:hypothetical protein
VADNNGGAGQAIFQSITVGAANSARRVGAITSPGDPVKVRAGTLNGS